MIGTVEFCNMSMFKHLKHLSSKTSPIISCSLTGMLQVVALVSNIFFLQLGQWLPPKGSLQSNGKTCKLAPGYTYILVLEAFG